MASLLFTQILVCISQVTTQNWWFGYATAWRKFLVTKCLKNENKFLVLVLVFMKKILVMVLVLIKSLRISKLPAISSI